MVKLLSRLARRMVQAGEDADDLELTRQSAEVGATRIAEVTDRGLADVCGEIRLLTLPPRARVPELVAELYDGTGTMTLVWLGRREIRGVAPGVRMRVRGRVAYRKGAPTIFNPHYELLPVHHGE